MNTTAMKTDIIRKFGFEHPATIYFFECCEQFADSVTALVIAYRTAWDWKEGDEE